MTDSEKGHGREDLLSPLGPYARRVMSEGTGRSRKVEQM